jgi:hypothetical protein
MVLMCAYQQITISEVMNEVGHLDQQRQFWQKNYRWDKMRQDGSCNTTMPQVTWLWQGSNSWQENK